VVWSRLSLGRQAGRQAGRLCMPLEALCEGQPRCQVVPGSVGALLRRARSGPWVVGVAPGSALCACLCLCSSSLQQWCVVAGVLLTQPQRLGGLPTGAQPRH
jgi:hypothetical protein